MIALVREYRPNSFRARIRGRRETRTGGCIFEALARLGRALGIREGESGRVDFLPGNRTYLASIDPTVKP